MIQRKESESKQFSSPNPGIGLPRGSASEESACNAEDPDGSLGGEDPPEKEMAPHSSILAWRIQRTKEPGGPESMGSQRVGHD